MVITVMGRLEAERSNLMRKAGTQTKYPGVKKVGHKKFRVRGKVRHPRTGKTKEMDRVVTCAGAHEAARIRADLLEEMAKAAPTAVEKRVRVGDYARSWIASKALKIDAGTARTYADALEQHVLPTLGDYYYDMLTRRDIQAWVDTALCEVRVLQDGRRKKYSPVTVKNWYRIFRTMTNDAIEDLELPRNPTSRISFPEHVSEGESNTLASDELARFLEAMRTHYPQHFALTAALAFTGLRFCHGSALRWEDWDQDKKVIRVLRRQVRGRVGPVSRKKRAPKEVPVEPQLAMILREHRHNMLVAQAPGFADGWMFPSSVGTLRVPSSVNKAWRRCLKLAEVGHRFTVHGLRYTFTDLVRRAKADAVVRRALTGHVTESMQDHYSTVSLDEKRTAVAGVHRLVAEVAVDNGSGDGEGPGDRKVGTRVGTGPESEKG